MAVADGVGVGVLVAVVAVAVAVAVCVAVGVGDADGVGVAVLVAVVAVAVGVAVDVRVAVAVAVGVGDAVAVGVGVGVATAARPTPLSFTFCGLLAPPSLKVSVPWNLRFDGGLNVTETGQLPPGDKMPGHTYGLKLKPMPLTAMFGAGKSALLLLVNVTVCGVLVRPAASLPKSIFFGATRTAGRLASATCAYATRPKFRIVASAIAIAAIACRWREHRGPIRRCLDDLIDRSPNG